MNVEAGKFYKTRDGRKEGPIEYNPKIINHGKFFCGSRYWTLCGHVYGAGVPCGGDLIAEWTDEPRAWGDWESAKGWEKDNDWLERIEPGCLQILMPDGEQRTINHFTDLPKGDFAAFRVKPEPVVETVTVYGLSDPGGWIFGAVNMGDTHRITFDVIDGAPDVSSVKMERIDD